MTQLSVVAAQGMKRPLSSLRGHDNRAVEKQIALEDPQIMALVHYSLHFRTYRDNMDRHTAHAVRNTCRSTLSALLLYTHVILQ